MKKKSSQKALAIQSVCLCCILALLFFGCAGKKRTPEEVLEAVCRSQNNLPAGRIYVLSAPSDDAKHPRKGWLASAFDQDLLRAALPMVEDAAFFSSYTHACEFAIFHCQNTKGAAAVSRLCLQRLNTLKLYWEGVEDLDTPLQNAGVTVRGSWVILYLCQDPEAALRAFRRTL